MAQLI